MHYKNPVIPHEFAAYHDDHMRAAHERVAALSIDDMHAYLQDHPVKLPIDDDTAGFVDLRPKDDHDEKSALVVPLPYANDWGVNMATRTRLLQESLPEAMRVVVFPNNVVGERRLYTMSRENRDELRRKGSFEWLAKKQMRSLEDAGVERVHYFGYSQGASVGAAALRAGTRDGAWDIGNSGLFEAPNSVERTAWQLRRDFMSAPNFNNAVNESAIPLLSEEQRSRGGLDVPLQALRFGRFGASALLGVNRSIQAAFGQARFIDDIEIASHRMSESGESMLTVGAGVKSRIMPAAALEKLDEFRGSAPALRVMRVDGYGHELGDNIVAHALLARAALSGSASR